MQPPAIDAHVDLTSPMAARSAKQLLTSEDADYEYSRALHLSCWRTFSKPPQDWPLALIDARTLDDTEGLVNTAIWLDYVPDLQNLPPPPKEGEEASAAYIFPYSEKFEWNYFGGMTRDELLCLKLNDSDHSRAWRAPHCAFFNDQGGCNPRESIDIRVCCYFK